MGGNGSSNFGDLLGGDLLGVDGYGDPGDLLGKDAG